MNNEQKVINFLEKNNNYITTKDMINLGIRKEYIGILIEKKIIKKVFHGIYMKESELEDEYYIINLRYPEAIFSYNTAFEILNLTNLTSHILDITTLRGKQINDNYNVHYVSEDKYSIGLIVVESPFGNPIKVYNAERCICDMLRSSDEFDLELQNRILKKYFESSTKNLKLLEEYGKIFGIYDKINTIIEVLMKW